MFERRTDIITYNLPGASRAFSIPGGWEFEVNLYTTVSVSRRNRAEIVSKVACSVWMDGDPFAVDKIARIEQVRWCNAYSCFALGAGMIEHLQDWLRLADVQTLAEYCFEAIDLQRPLVIYVRGNKIGN